MKVCKLWNDILDDKISDKLLSRNGHFNAEFCWPLNFLTTFFGKSAHAGIVAYAESSEKKVRSQ